MKRQKSIDPDNPPTRASDWIGAQYLRRGERHARPNVAGFRIYRASTDRDLFAVVADTVEERLPKCPRNGSWTLFRTVPRTGGPRVGFDEAAADRDIRQSGYHLVRLNTQARKRA